MGAIHEQIALVLSEEQERFAFNLSQGWSVRRAAIEAGIHEQTGYKYSKLPQIGQRVSELLGMRKREDLGGIASRAWIETRIIAIADKAEEGNLQKAQLDSAKLELECLMSLAKLKGLIVERKQVQQQSLTRIEKVDVQSAVRTQLDRLDPGARAEMQRLLDAPADVDADPIDGPDQA